MNLPVCLFGYVEGPIRWESSEHKDWYIGYSQWLFNEVPIIDPFELRYYSITHLQKKSKWGFLLMWPFCFHFWYTFKYQEQVGDAWIPGSEKVFYTRSPGWRFDFAQMKYIITKGYLNFSLHWD